MKTQTESINALLLAIDQAQTEQRFDIASDLRMLHDKYTKTSKHDYLQLLQRLIEKYTATEQATVHAALVAKCKAGDAAAIKLYYEQQAAYIGSDGDEVTIVDDISKVK